MILPVARHLIGVDADQRTGNRLRWLEPQDYCGDPYARRVPLDTVNIDIEKK